MKAIVAMGRNRVIGLNDKLPWPPIKEDFKWFKEFTINNTIVIGKKTFDTLPPLKDRNIIVITNSIKESVSVNCNTNTKYIFTNKLDTIPKDAIIAGGSTIYKLFLPQITEFYVTHINGDYPGDTYLPHFEHLFTNKEVVKEFDGHKVIKYTK